MKNIEVILEKAGEFEHVNRLNSRGRLLPDNRKGAQKPRIHWKVWDDLIGNISDADLARRIGCDRSTVTVRRNKIGIPAHPLVRRKAGSALS